MENQLQERFCKAREYRVEEGRAPFALMVRLCTGWQELPELWQEPRQTPAGWSHLGHSGFGCVPVCALTTKLPQLMSLALSTYCCGWTLDRNCCLRPSF